MAKEDNYLTLIDETIKLYQLAVRKGFEQSDNIKPTFFGPDLPIAEIFCNTVCAVIARWLRNDMKITVWVESIEHNQYKPFADYKKKLGIDAKTFARLFTSSEIAGKYYSYEEAWLAGLNYVLETLLDK